MTDPFEQLGNRLARMQRHRRKWARRQGITCWRLYDRDMSDQPLVVDWYDGDAVCWTMRRTKDETTEQDEAWQAGVASCLAGALELPPERVWMKRRQQQSDRQHGGQYHRLGEHAAVRKVIECGLSLEVNLSDYLDVGLFLDHRPLRKRVGSEAKGLDVLNLFCYTGVFTCHAAKGGARSTTSVDLSNTYLDWAQRNLEANELHGPHHTIVRADCLAWLATEVKRGHRYDLIVCDPPTFSNSTAMAASFSIDRDHDWIVGHLRDLLRPDGIAYFSTNSRRFDPGLSLVDAKEITNSTTDEDFRSRPAHRAWLIKA